MTIKPFAAFTVCITRYNNKTWAERTAWLAANPDYACIYKSPVPIKSDIPYEAPLFVLEMNNDTNRIMGIGRIVNEVRADRAYRIYATDRATASRSSVPGCSTTTLTDI
jgi:hypothetical protein